MEKSNYDFDPIKQKILLEARRLVETYHIDTGHRCIRDLRELEEFVHRLKTYPGNDHDFITMHLGKYSCQFWERGYCNFGFDGATEEEFVENFLMHLFFKHCRSCYKGHYLCMDFPGSKERDGQICCTDVLTGHQCYGSTSAEAEAAMKAYIDRSGNSGRIWSGGNAMKTKERTRPVLKAIRSTVGWILIVLGGLLAGSSALCAILALFGGLETESFGEQLGLFALSLILMCVGLCVLIGGRWIKNGTFGKKQVKPAAQKVPKSDYPLSTEDQKPLEEIERNIDSVAGTIQANPMSPGRGVGEKERKNNMPLQPMDYPVPFTELLIYPNRIVKRSKAAQVLHEEETASCGTLFEEKVSLCEANCRHILICEKQERSEHGPQWDMACSMIATLSMNLQQCHHIPLTKWILSLSGWANLRQYTDEVCVRTDGTPPWENFKRYRRIKETHMKNSHDQPGWNCTYDEIGLCFDSPDLWYLRRESHWREAPSGLPYNVTIVMKLLPGVEKESDEALCGLLNSLPWWNPDKADRLMWDARNWLDVEWLQKLAESNDSMRRKHPHHDGYEKALDEVLKQLCLLEEPKPAVEEEEKMKKTLTFKSALRSDLKGYRMDMHTDSGEKFRFVLSGLVAFNPNQGGMCGYGTDSWLFHCVLGNEEYILNFEDDAGYGTCWSCALISPENAKRLKELEAVEWLKLMYKSDKQIHHLHPDHAAKARVDLDITASRCGPIDARKFYGR